VYPSCLNYGSTEQIVKRESQIFCLEYHIQNLCHEARGQKQIVKGKRKKKRNCKRKKEKEKKVTALKSSWNTAGVEPGNQEGPGC